MTLLVYYGVVRYKKILTDGALILLAHLVTNVNKVVANLFIIIYMHVFVCYLYIGPYITTRCLDVSDTCMQDESCKRLMNDMERKCKNVHVWNEYSKNDPTCSENCYLAIFELIRNPIGYLWSQCDCHVPHTRSTFPSVAKNDAFEEKCVQYRRNRRTFCFHKYSCKGKYFLGNVTTLDRMSIHS